MDDTQLKQLATIRSVVGFLGEKEQLGWWQSSFFAASSPTFLSPVFAKTQILAQATGVTDAAARVHDERIGVGSVYHLFRLPEDVEQGIHRVLHDPDICGQLTAYVSKEDAALDFLDSLAERVPEPAVGPIRVGDLTDLRYLDSWHIVVAHYLKASEMASEVYPYFTDRAS